MKTKEELTAIKEEIEELNQKLAELNEEELEQVAGGCFVGIPGFPLIKPFKRPIDINQP